MIYRELAAADPDRHQPDLASGTGQARCTSCPNWIAQGDALATEQEAVTMYRELTAASPDRYRPDLARVA